MSDEHKQVGERFVRTSFGDGPDDVVAEDFWESGVTVADAAVRDDAEFITDELAESHDENRSLDDYR